MPARSDRISSSAESGCFSLIATCCGPVTSTPSTVTRSPLMLERGSVRARSRLNFTAAASSGVPSWKVTPARMLSSRVLGSGLLHDSARPGSAFKVAGSKSISVSKIG